MALTSSSFTGISSTLNAGVDSRASRPFENPGRSSAGPANFLTESGRWQTNTITTAGRSAPNVGRQSALSRPCAAMATWFMLDARGRDESTPLARTHHARRFRDNRRCPVYLHESPRDDRDCAESTPGRSATSRDRQAAAFTLMTPT